MISREPASGFVAALMMLLVAIGMIQIGERCRIRKNPVSTSFFCFAFIKTAQDFYRMVFVRGIGLQIILKPFQPASDGSLLSDQRTFLGFSGFIPASCPSRAFSFLWNNIVSVPPVVFFHNPDF